MMVIFSHVRLCNGKTYFVAVCGMTLHCSTSCYVILFCRDVSAYVSKLVSRYIFNVMENEVISNPNVRKWAG